VEIHGWIAISKHGVILDSFRENPSEATKTAQQILRLVGGAPLISKFRVVKAKLTIDNVNFDTEVK
jgi:hypothetical protein